MKTATKKKQAKPANKRTIQADPDQQKVDLKRADALMIEYVQTAENKKNLEASIAAELASYNKRLKANQDELIAIGNRNLNAFDKDGNLHFEKAYLHISKQTVVLTKRKFNWTDFLEQYADLAKINFVIDRMKKAFLDKDQRQQLKGLGVTLTTMKVMEVIVPPTKANGSDQK